MAMIIRDMFRDNINRIIGGVVKVGEKTDAVLAQELEEYVVTRELRKHFAKFFGAYADAFNEPTDNIGVWISGFFGSGKSHFLKMLSFILSNVEFGGKKAVDVFRSKWEDPASFMDMDRASKAPTDAILFNIDVESFTNKDRTAVLRVFAKMFYSFLGFYGEDLKVARLEQYIESEGKTQQFKDTFEKIAGKDWVSARKSALAFKRKAVAQTMSQVLGMSEDEAAKWVTDKTETELSIAALVKEIQEYVSQKPKDYRLLFMVDEVGQYVGADTDLLLNLQSLVEEIGSKCQGKVWVVCTGQEAIDEIIKARENEFSRIQARFKTRLSLSSSAADEVIQERILKKTPEAAETLRSIYETNDSVLRNLFSFKDCVLDIKGFTGAEDFARNFPFVPYQFRLLQKVFGEIRKHGNSGTHLAGGERSMLSGFQEAAQRIQNENEFALAPFYLFYDTVSSFLNSDIRRVIERCQEASEKGNGIEAQDVDVLKLLYLIRYVDDVKANLDNIIILMADNIQLDKITKRDEVQKSLDRLLSQNYIGRTGETYNFLTNEEQDIQREIKMTPVDTSDVVGKIGSIIFDQIYDIRKFRYGNGKYDFDFDRFVDNQAISNGSGGMVLQILTAATDVLEKRDNILMSSSSGRAVVVLADIDYYNRLENAIKIRKYIKQRNVIQLPKSMQDIIRSQSDIAASLEQEAMEYISEAIEKAVFFVDGNRIECTGDAKKKLNQALDVLVGHVYRHLGLIEHNYDSDLDLLSILENPTFEGSCPNAAAVAKVEEFLEMKDRQKMTVSMADILRQYGDKPYGWREIDIAAIVATLVSAQKVTIKYAGNTVQPGELAQKLDLLHRKSEVGKTVVSKRISVSGVKIKNAVAFLRDYMHAMSVPNDEDGLVKFIIDNIDLQKNLYDRYKDRYIGHNYPDRGVVSKACDLMENILSQKSDNIALVDRLLEKQDELLDCRENMEKVVNFFNSQVSVFDSAVKVADDLKDDADYIAENADARQAMEELKSIIEIPASGPYAYGRIPELNELISRIKTAHSEMLKAKRSAVLNTIAECAKLVEEAAAGNGKVAHIVSEAKIFLDTRKQKVETLKNLALIDAQIPQITGRVDDYRLRIEEALKPVATPTVEGGEQPIPAKKYVRVSRQQVFRPKRLESESEIDAYVAEIRKQMLDLLKGNDGIELN